MYTPSGHLKLYPLKVFCYGNLKASLQQLLLHSGFAIAYESTRNLCLETSGKLSDLYQGQMWKDFLTIDGVDFLSAPYCYWLMLNIDWFEPFHNCVFAVGVLYLVVMNLPRSQ